MYCLSFIIVLSDNVYVQLQLELVCISQQSVEICIHFSLKSLQFTPVVRQKPSANDKKGKAVAKNDSITEELDQSMIGEDVELDE